MTTCNDVFQKNAQKTRKWHALLRPVLSIRFSRTFSVFFQSPWVQVQDLPTLNFCPINKNKLFQISDVSEGL